MDSKAEKNLKKSERGKKTMAELLPCPFCGFDMEYYSTRFKRDRKKILGIYHVICTIECGRCPCSIRQAGTTREKAEEHAIEFWNRRAENG